MGSRCLKTPELEESQITDKGNRSTQAKARWRLSCKKTRGGTRKRCVDTSLTHRKPEKGVLQPSEGPDSLKVDASREGCEDDRSGRPPSGGSLLSGEH